MNEPPAQILANLFDQKTVLVLEKLLSKKGIFYLRDISRESGVSLATTYRIIQKLIKLGIVAKLVHGKFNYYKLKKDSPIYSQLCKLILGAEPDPLAELIHSVKKEFPSVKILIEKKDKTKGFIIGEQLNSPKIQEIVEKVNKEHETKFKFVILTEEQFKQMFEMGLISKESHTELT